MDMRFHLLFLPLLAVSGISAHELLESLDEDTKEMVKMLHDTCVEETKIDESLIERARKGDFADDQTLKTYMACIFLQTGAMSDDGELDKETILALIPEKFHESAHKISESCKDIAMTSPPETAMNFNKCFYNTAPDMYLLV